MDEDYPLNKFIDRVEHNRQWLEAKQASSLYRVRNERTNPTSASETQPENRPSIPNEVKIKRHPVNPQRLNTSKGILGT